MIKRLLVLCVFMTGCGLYWGGGDDQCVPTPVSGIPAQGYRDPQTGTCEYFGGGGGGGSCCGTDCVYNDGTAMGGAQPNWGQCNSACDGLDENSCIETVSCHAAYLQKTYNDTVTTTTFLGCWATALDYATQPPTTCVGLDAQTCSQRDFCSMVYTSQNGAAQQFGSCIDESHPGCGIDIGCPLGSHCEQECTPCNTMGCQDTCTPTCVPDAGWGQCTGQITCNLAPPSCPANTTAGIANGCWSGYCIPTASCELAACETLGSEAACTARPDCTAIYTGSDCTCTMTGGCTCATETYAKCETTWML